MLKKSILFLGKEAFILHYKARTAFLTMNIVNQLSIGMLHSLTDAEVIRSSGQCPVEVPSLA